VVIGITLAGVGGIVALLYPVLAAPVGADDRYWYLLVPGQTEGSYLAAMTSTFGGIASEAGNGRIATLAFLLRRFNAIFVTDVSVATSTPIVVVQAFMKLGLLLLVVLTCRAFLRSLRWRSEQNEVVGMGHRSVLLVSVTTAVFLAAGAQAHSQFRNGWTSYAPLTYTAVIVVIGVATLIIRLTRKFAAPGNGWKVAALSTAVLVGVLLNFSYELFYVAVPVTILVLLLQPANIDARIGRRAKLFVGGAFLSAFTAVFVAFRIWIASACSNQDCYTGTQLDLNIALVRTFGRNFLGSVPGVGQNELKQDLAFVGWNDKMPGFIAPIPLLIAAVTAAALLYLWWRLTRKDCQTREVQVLDSVSRAESRMLVRTATIPLAAALGTAFVMSLSEQSHTIIESIGEPYRNTMATWTLLSLTGAMLIRAATLRWSRRSSAVLLSIVGILVAVVGGHTLTANLSGLAATRVMPAMEASETIQWEVVLGDTSSEGDARRCASFDALAGKYSEWTGGAIAKGANSAFEHYHGLPYCSTGLPDLSEVH